MPAHASYDNGGAMRVLAAVTSLALLCNVAELAAQTWAGTAVLLAALTGIGQIIWRWEA